MAALPGEPNHFDVPMRNWSTRGFQAHALPRAFAAAHPGASVFQRGDQESGARLIAGHGQRTTVLDQRHQDVELPGALDELLGAVDRIDDPAPRNAQAVIVVLTLFAQDRVVGKTLGQDGTNRLVGGEVRVGYGRPIALRIRRRRFSVIELPDDGAGRERRRDGAIEIRLMTRMLPNQSVVPFLDSSLGEDGSTGIWRGFRIDCGFSLRFTLATSFASPILR